VIDYSDLKTGLLEPTATYLSRAWGWFRAVPGTGDGMGLLSIELTKPRSRETTRYAVEEVEPLPGLLGRQFRLTKSHTDTVYIVAIGGLPSCTCIAGQTRAGAESVCKHQDAMRALLAAGHLGGDPSLAVALPSLDSPREDTCEATTRDLSSMDMLAAADPPESTPSGKA